MTRCTAIVRSYKGSGPSRCALPAGHKRPHQSQASLDNQTEYNRSAETRKRKNKWDRDNSWRLQTICPNCGGLMWKPAKRCRRCTKRRSPNEHRYDD